MRDARDLGYASVNVDFIYGLPHQRPESWLHTIEIPRRALFRRRICAVTLLTGGGCLWHGAR